MLRSNLAALALALVAGSVAIASPAVADDGWHPVNEEWQPYEGGDGLYLPAERYCGDFDMQTTPVFEKIRFRVLSRWDSGEPRETKYAGPLISEATNLATGATARYNVSGKAVALQREDGSLARYQSDGPVGMGFPVGSIGLPPGFYLFRGHHVVTWDETGTRTLTVDRGTESDICEMVD